MDEDIQTLTRIKKFQQKRNRSFDRMINNKDLSSDEMDELFLSA